MSELNNPFDRFPEMRPVRNIPPLTRVNGIGTTLIGGRDHDAETQTYVKTLAFTVLFLPVLAVGAYRVADAPNGGWYFLGKVPLSGLAKACNLLLLLAVLAVAGLIGWNAYTDSPDYKAGRKLAEADRLLADGMAAEAAQGYADVLLGNTSRADEARDRLKGLIESPPASLEQAAAVFKIAVDLHQLNRPVADDLYQRGAKQAEDHADASPALALILLEGVAPLAPRPADVLPLRRRLLEALLAQDPQNAEVASRLAVVCSEQGDEARCEAVLSPVAGRLGALEGAALLGRIYSHKRQYDKAIALLQPYLDAHLPKLHAAEKKFKAAAAGLPQRVQAQLQNGAAADFDYKGYEAADMQRKQQMIQEYMVRKLREDPSIQAAEKEMEGERMAVPAALDLGIALLNQAQTRADPAARKKDLEKAEKTFLAIRDQAGEANEYRLFLGRVYYWLGKPADGRKLFDELLKANNRDSKTLSLVGNVLREVGEVSGARDLIEEAYNHEGNTAPRQELALLRAIIHRDLDDEISWLGKADPQSAEVRALLSGARGRKAEQEGKDAEAAGHYREALKAYDSMAVTTATLNNSALDHLALYRLTREPEQLRQAMTKLDRAVAKQPDDPLILQNAAHLLLENAVHDLIGPDLDLKILKRGADLDLLSFLCRDRDAKARYVAGLRRHPGWLKAQSYFEKLLVLSPKQSYAYARLVQVYAWMRDVDGLRDVWRRLQGVELDLADQNRDLLEGYTGKNDKKKQEDLKNALTRNQAILAAARTAGGATFAAAASGHVYAVIQYKSQAARSELPVPDADALVRLAEEVHAAAPSQGTTSLLGAALAYRAHQALAGQDAAYAALAKRTQRSLAYALLTYVLAREGPLRDKVLANADVRRAAALDHEHLEAFPDDVSPSMWPWLQPTHPEEAARVAKLLQEDPLEKLQRSFAGALSPLSAGTLLNQYLMLRLAGKNAEAAAVFKGAAAKGVPLPES
jgi:predicted Zn-dependent protease